MARSARIDPADSDTGQDGDQSQGKITIGQHYRKSVPEPGWLRDSEINGNRITEWWKSKENLTINGLDFAAYLASDKKPTVGDWKAKAREFVSGHPGAVPLETAWIDNPQGYANVLKGTLPFYILVPAVRDVSEESKGTKSSPFGRLLSALLASIEPDQRSAVEEMLGKVSSQMNRVGGAARIPLISETEKRLNTLLSDFFAECDLEIEFETPSLETILGMPRLFVDDGFRTAVENKGHGLQRAVIFTILRRYADHMTAVADGKKRNLILAVEEPELYMHPQAQRTVRRVFTKIKEAGDQVFFCTHSSLLLDVAYFDEIIRLERRTEIVDDKKAVVSTVAQLPMHRMIRDLETRVPKLKGKVTAESMRDLYSHAYNPRRSEGFFASKIILVEGLTEEYSLPIYAEAIPGCSFDLLGISVVECGGKASAMRGTWRVQAYADPKGDPLAQAAFLVEDFEPERIAFALTTDVKGINPGDPPAFPVEARFLYGAPAAGLTVEGESVVRPAAGLADHPGYRFGLSDDNPEPATQPIAESRTDAEGRAEVLVELPELVPTSRPLEAQVQVRIAEPGGRAVERDLTLPVLDRQSRIGIRP